MRILIFGKVLRAEAARLTLTFLARGVELPFFSKEYALEAYLLHHSVGAMIADRDNRAALERYGFSVVTREVSSPEQLEAIIEELIATVRPRRRRPAA